MIHVRDFRGRKYDLAIVGDRLEMDGNDVQICTPEEINLSNQSTLIYNALQDIDDSHLVIYNDLITQIHNGCLPDEGELRRDIGDDMYKTITMIKDAHSHLERTLDWINANSNELYDLPTKESIETARENMVFRVAHADAYRVINRILQKWIDGRSKITPTKDQISDLESRVRCSHNETLASVENSKVYRLYSTGEINHTKSGDGVYGKHSAYLVKPEITGCYSFRFPIGDDHAILTEEDALAFRLEMVSLCT